MPWRPSSLLLLGAAVLAISSSAVLVRYADTSAISIAFWRTAGGALILAPAVRRTARRLRRRQWLGIAAAGAALAVHFAAWLTSLELTSVAASVTLVTTAPLFVALLLTFTGRRPGPVTWAALGLAAIGSAVITGGDAIDPGAWEGTALQGDALALVGAVAMAVYLVIGDRLRTSLSTAAYAGPTYAVAAGGLAVAVALGPAGFSGYDATTWLAIGAMILGPQLAGHTVLNHLLERLGSVSVSLALLLEPVGAAILVWLLFEEVPPLAAWIGGPLVMAALAVQISGGRRRDAGGPGCGP